MYPRKCKKERSYKAPAKWLVWLCRDCSETAGTPLFNRRLCDSRAEKRRGMQATPDIMRTIIHAGHACVECIPFSVSVIRVYVVCVIVAAVGNVISIANFEIGAHAPISLCALLLLAFLLTNLTLTCLARLAGLQSLVGLTTRLATSTA